MVMDAPGAGGGVGWPVDWGGGLANFGQVCVEFLLRGDFKGNVYPWLAESYKIADDFTSITFNLRKGVKFHDGTDFNAEAAKWNLENQINAKRAPSWASVDVIDEYTIRVNLTQWQNTILTQFADAEEAYAGMVSPTAFEKNGEDWLRQNPVATGPFKFVSWQPEVGLKAVKNPDYWQEGKPYLDGVEVLVIPDTMTRLAFLQSKEGDMTQTYSGKPAADYDAMDMNVRLLVNGTICLYPDTANPDSPWANPKVREAAEYAIDREAIAEGLGYGYWKAPYQIPPRDCSAYNPNFTLGREYNPEKAKQLLAEAGYADGFDTTIFCFAGGLNRDAAVAVQGYLIAAGIRAELDIPEIPKLMATVMQGWNNGAILMPILFAGNFNGALSRLSPESPFYKSWLRTPEFTEALNATLTSPAPDIELARAVTDIISKDASIIPLYEIAPGNASWPYVMDIGFGERGGHAFLNYESAWLDK